MSDRVMILDLLPDYPFAGLFIHQTFTDNFCALCSVLGSGIPKINMPVSALKGRTDKFSQM